MLWWLLLLFILVAGTYCLLVQPHRFWKVKGVKQGNPTFLLGESSGTFFQKQSFAEMVEMVYNMFPGSRYSGIYQFFVPTLVIRDPDLIKQITVKDFDHFVDHRSFIPEDADPLWVNNLFALKGQKWRNMRSTLSPAFTSSKMKYMFSLITQSGEQFVQHFLNLNENLITVEMKDIFTRFTNDVIANTAFGIECNSLGNRNNEFYLMGKEATDRSSIVKRLRFFGYLLVPKLYRIFKIGLFPREVGDFFYQLIQTNIASRENHGIVRPDMINLLLEARKNGLKHEEADVKEDTGFATAQECEINKTFKVHKAEITDEVIAAQALIFFFAGFDSVSTLMCFLSYELGVNQDVQERLIREVDDTLEACKGKITYEALLGMTYLDMVVSESLRKWPNALFIDRICTKPYTIKPKTIDEIPVHLEEKSVLMIPVFGIHRDPQYWPNPEHFDPERFSEENKRNIKPYTYLPFGSGPRNCIGSRFALLETKLLIFYILTHFKIVPVEKTQIPAKISKKQLSLTVEKGFWFGLQRRLKTKI